MSRQREGGYESSSCSGPSRSAFDRDGFLPYELDPPGEIKNGRFYRKSVRGPKPNGQSRGPGPRPVGGEKNKKGYWAAGNCRENKKSRKRNGCVSGQRPLYFAPVMARPIQSRGYTKKAPPFSRRGLWVVGGAITQPPRGQVRAFRWELAVWHSCACPWRAFPGWVSAGFRTPPIPSADWRRHRPWPRR